MSIMYVRAHDAPTVPAAAFRSEPGTLVQVPSDRRIKNLQGVVQMMINATRSSGSIDVLRFLAHGNNGRFALLAPPAGLVNAANAQIFRAFADRMNPQGRVELHCCGAASDTAIDEVASPVSDQHLNLACVPGTAGGGAGRAFIQAMANAFGVPCTGAVNCQFFLNDWNFEGPTVTCYPVSRS
jgi:hypothetical protein